MNNEITFDDISSVEGLQNLKLDETKPINLIISSDEMIDIFLALKNDRQRSEDIKLRKLYNIENMG